MNGCIQVYTGNGKGKTTAALGLTLRAVGAGMRVYIGQFLKKGIYSEVKALRRFASSVQLQQFGLGKFIKGLPAPAEKRAAQRGLAALHRAMSSGRFDVIIADEINCAITCGVLTVAEVLALMQAKPKRTELVLTGRGAHRRIIRQADLVSVIADRKHPYQAGQKCRIGIEH